MNIETVNELIQSLESAGELSIKEQKYLDVMRWAIRVAGERDAALNAERVWEKTMMEACGEDGPASVANEIRSLRALRDTAIQALKSQVEQLAAENVALKDGVKKAIEDIQCFYDSYGWHVSEDGESETAVVALDDAKGSIEHFALSVKTPATDRIVAAQRSAFVDEAVAKITESGALTFGDCIVALCQLREGVK
ncbi:hypothetical protein HV240_12630 [Klebsiella grimontii]|uniref:hypothetical protein n=1 Tax=Klebsiella grimontii TaxID=2058152 RepID=UPI0015EB0A24|nr:hypothetical protein [Klebsiella grimontii]QLU74818.1 hypothetical protein HV240_12630 [Klebsiella grimontii]